MTDIFGWIILIANVILVCLIFAQFRRQMRPIITTKIINYEKMLKNGAKAIPQILERGHRGLYLYVNNISDNLAVKMKINYEFLLDNEKLIEVTENIDYLNPNEATYMIIRDGKIIEKHPDLFEEITEGQTTKKIPKKTMNLSLNICVLYNPILGRFLPHKTKDSYEIRWGSLEEFPELKYHPHIDYWNRRGNLYIEKIKR